MGLCAFATVLCALSIANNRVSEMQNEVECLRKAQVIGGSHLLDSTSDALRKTSSDSVIFSRELVAELLLEKVANLTTCPPTQYP